MMMRAILGKRETIFTDLMKVQEFSKEVSNIQYE